MRLVSMTVGVVAGITLPVACGGGESEPPPEPFACIEGWPRQTDATIAPPLAVVPAVVWRQPVSFDSSNPARVMTLTGSHVVVALFLGIARFDRKTGLPSPTAQPATGFGSLSFSQAGPAADSAGNLYGLAQTAYSLSPAGTVRWEVGVGYPPVDYSAGEFFLLTRGPVVLSPDGVVFVQGGGSLHALRTNDGSEIWRADTGQANAGAGPVIVVGADVRRARDGQLLGQVMSSQGGRLRVWALAEFGFLGWHASENRFFVEAVDPCDRSLWSLGAGPSTYLSVEGVGPTGLTYLSRRPSDSADSPYVLMTVSTEGTIRSAVTVDGRFLAVGADGTAYILDRLSNPTQLVAIGPDLRESWRFPVEGNCSGEGALGDDGVLYLACWHNSVTEIVAVQTTSPGLARTGWPTASHDAAATSWLAP